MYWSIDGGGGERLIFGMETKKQNSFMFHKKKIFLKKKKIKGFFFQREEVKWDLLLFEKKNSLSNKIFLYHFDNTRAGL